ncbi:MAG: hypothetical protein Q7S31_00560 [bacterium]|nr:hypothetical protein [bacterium]
MRFKYIAIFIVAVVIGLAASWFMAKLNWSNQNSKNLTYESEAAKIQQETGTSKSKPAIIPSGITLSPTASARLKSAPTEVAVSFPFPPKAGTVRVEINNLEMTLPDDDLLTIRNNSYVFPLPATASAGVYSIRFSGCPEIPTDSGEDEGCLSGSYGFVVE